MVIRFSIENCKSFKERQTLDLMAARTCKERKVENTFPIDDTDSLLKAVAVYGANASGKSNLFSSLEEMLDFIQFSFNARAPIEDTGFIPFCFASETVNKPSLLEIEFIVGERWYRYGFSVSAKYIESEWLFFRDKSSKRYQVHFIRKRENGEDLINIKPSFEGADGQIAEKTRDNSLFLSTCAAFAVKEAMTILKALDAITIINTHSSNRFERTAKLLSDKAYHDSIVNFMRNTDACINDIEVERVTIDTGRMNPNGSPITRTGNRIWMVHRIGLDGEQQMRVPLGVLGSQGTQKAFDLAGPIFWSLFNGTSLFIDELDSRIHPILTREIIKLYNSVETNPKNAQLVFNTHDTNLLNCKIFNKRTDKREPLLRRDQIYFTERNGEFASRLYSLVDFKDENGASIRNDASFEKEYLAGEYGAIPFIGSFIFASSKDSEAEDGQDL